MYKHRHSFFDPNIWHLDEELRKQVESFAKCFILTGQEARFVHRKFLAKYPEHEKASVAGLKLQWAFEMDFNKDDCYQLIENYCNGGDGYLTEDVMRDACGLPVRVRQVQEEDGLGNLLAGEQDSADERDERDNQWTNLRGSIIAHVLDNDLDILTFYAFKKDHGVVRPAIFRQKTSKEKPGAFFPMMTFGSQLQAICPQPSLDATRLEFEEEHDVGLSKRCAFGCRGRSVNADIMKNYYKANLPVGKKGRRSAEQEEILNRYQELIRKIDDHEKSINHILETKKRRLVGKRSQEEDNIDATKSDGPVASMGSSMKRSLSVTYRYSEKQDYSVRARRYTVNGGVQSMSRRLQYHVVGGHTFHLDITNCCMTLVQQIIAKTWPEPPLLEDLAQILGDIVKNRTEFVNKIGLGIPEGKDVIDTVFNGGSPPSNLKKHELIVGLQKIWLYVRWMACNLLHDDYMSMSDKKDKTFVSATMLSLMWTSVEDMFISIKKCENVTHEETGFNVKIAVKKHMSFLELVKERGAHGNSSSNVPPELLEKGNCIPCALWHVVPLSRQAIIAAISDSSLEKNVAAKKQLYRDYRSVASMSAVDLVCCPGLPEAHIKSYVIHFEGNGFPHCLAVKLDRQGTNVTVLEGAMVYKMSLAALRDFHHAAVDGSTMVSYWKRDPNDKLCDKFALLLDMVAGADCDYSDEEVAGKGVGGGLSRISHDEDVPVICDNILESLCQEVAEVRNNLQEKSFRQGGKMERMMAALLRRDEWHYVSMEWTPRCSVWGRSGLATAVDCKR
ncbi:unnamed protein product [Symbiodinium sp. KB8]|nr:unnamed protein product [Symbiodinium sp. KB8]